MLKYPTVIAMLFLVLALSPSEAAELNLFEWSAVAPTVVNGEIVGAYGKYVEMAVTGVFRGGVEPEANLLLDLKYANRRRDFNVDPRPLRLRVGKSYILLLQDVPAEMKDDMPVYRIVRGPRGARELPSEGSDAILSALARFIEIQGLRDEAGTWRLLGRMFEETNPILLETALGQFLKFRRGRPDLLPTIRPLLDHPGADIRENASRLIGQIVTRYGYREIPEEAELRSDLVARARRDEAVPVRVAATEALQGFRGKESMEILEQIAAEDPDQSVRYVAETILLSLRQEGADDDRNSDAKGGNTGVD